MYICEFLRCLQSVDENVSKNIYEKQLSISDVTNICTWILRHSRSVPENLGTNIRESRISNLWCHKYAYVIPIVNIKILSICDQWHHKHSYSHFLEHIMNIRILEYLRFIPEILCTNVCESQFSDFWRHRYAYIIFVKRSWEDLRVKMKVFVPVMPEITN